MNKMDKIFFVLPDSLVMNVQNLYGGLLKVAARNPIGCQVVKVLHGGLGRFLGGAARTAHLDEGRPAVDISRQTMRKFFSSIMDEENEGEDVWAFSFSTCPYGLNGDEHRELCHAVMNFEEQLVRSLGGELVILERIPEGAKRCRFLIKANDSIQHK